MLNTKEKSFLRTTTQLLISLLGLYVCAATAQSPTLIVTGADEELATNVRSHVSLPKLQCDAPRQRLARSLPSIRAQVIRAGRALGYYRLTQRSAFRSVDDCWVLDIELVPGPPVIIAKISIAIDGESPLFEPITNDLPLQIGDQLDQGSYERIKTRLSTRAIEEGYFSARFVSSELRLDLESNSADIDIRFDPGQRFQVGEISVIDTGFLAPEFIERYIDITPGDAYSSASLLALRDSLNDSLYFSQVTVTPDIDNAINNKIPIEVGLALRPQRAYSVGGGVTTDIGPRLRADYVNRYSTRAGHRVDANGGASPVRSNLDLRYSIPLAKPATESLVLSGGFLSEDTDSFVSETFKVAAAYNFNTLSSWRQSYFVDYQHDEFGIGDNNETSDLLIAGVSFNRTKADDVLYTTEGWRMFAQLRGASADLLSPESFAQLNVAGKYITSLGPGRVLLKAELGTTMVDDISNLPVSIQYFAGGDQSVRGYKYQSLGPLNSDGDVIGGKHLITAGIEYDFFLMPNWKLALFSDVGNAFDSFSDYELNQSVGVGVRWLSPIGPIRLDLASALDNGNDFRIHVTMGPDL